MKEVHALVSVVAFVVLMSGGCGKREQLPREKSLLEVSTPRVVSELTVPDLACAPDGVLYMTLFIHSRFPSATASHDAIALLASADGGAGWQERSPLASMVTYGAWGHDLAVDRTGRLFFTWVASHRAEGTPVPFKTVLCARSGDGGRSWSDPVEVSSPRSGQRRQPAIAVSGNRVFIAWLDGKASGAAQNRSGGAVYYSVSRDGGWTWSADACIETDRHRRTSASGKPSVCITDDGMMHCAYFSMREHDRRKKGGFWLASSRDGGRTFTNSLQNVGPLGDLCLREIGGRLFLAAVYVKDIKSISMLNPQTSQEVQLFIRDEDGQGWSDAVRIDDDPARKHKRKLQILPLGRGRLGAVWYDERGGVYAASSPDSGRTWDKNVRLLSTDTDTVVLDAAPEPAGSRFHLAASLVKTGPGDETHFLTVAIESE